MKVVIFAGGLGTRLAEETTTKPKPMVEVGGKPILWHIMKIYSYYGYNNFIICLGYKGFMIKEYFLNYFLYNSDLTIEVGSNQIDVHFANTESFKVTLIDTGIDTNTAGRLKRVKKYIGDDDAFMLTYGDGVADIKIDELVKFHRDHGRLATLTSVQMPGRFGNLETDEKGKIINFQEKPEGDGLWINGGFFVLNSGIFKYLEKEMDETQWEKQPLVEIANDGELMTYRHNGFWKCMDAMRDKIELEELWETGKAKWRIWKI